MKKGKVFIIFIVSVLLYIFFNTGLQMAEPVESLDVPVGIGVDLIKGESGALEYSIPIIVYGHGEQGVTSSLIQVGKGKTVGATRENRQLKSNKTFIIGLEKVVVIGEEMAKDGLETYIDAIFTNPTVNDTSLGAVCKGKAMDIFKHHTDSYPNEADYIEGMLKSSPNYNFFSDNYKLMDIYVRADSEGRNLVLPYIEIIDDKLQITGSALFNKAKMVKKLDISDTKTMNMLRENKVEGILSIKEDLKEYINFYGKTKRKVKCDMKDNKFVFTIDLTLNGEIVSNTLYKDMAYKPDLIRKFQSKMEYNITQTCNRFIEKMKNDYKVDCLELGQYAVAKYGREKGVDWNKEVCNSKIIVNVKVNVDKVGRGNY